ncbi:MAG: amidohydrolase [Treponema sp.]|nr:amidohydrolase [Treponema sp.]
MNKIIVNGKIYLGNKTFCQALLIRDSHIAATGANRDILAQAPAGAEKIDAEGALVLPAFHDSHLHVTGIGRRAGGIEAEGAASIDEVIERGRNLISALNPGRGVWIQGGGVNPDLFTRGEKRDLCREDVDKISQEFPVILSRHCGHVIYCNSAALRLAGLAESAPEVEGGTVERDGNGRPAGVFRENASALVRKYVPAVSDNEQKSWLRLAIKKLHSLGITSCGSNDTGGPNFESVVRSYRETFDELRRQGLPGLRVTLQCGISGSMDLLDEVLDRGRQILWEDPQWGFFLKTGSVKLFIDGTLGGHTAWMRQPYRDKSETSGFPVVDPLLFEKFIQKAAARGMQTLTHSIGDAGVEASIKAIEKVTGPGSNPQRHGIIHCQITSVDLLERMAKNKILALVQPVFLSDDRHIAADRVGPGLALSSYAWGSMHRLGIPVGFGTDAPVCSPDPLLNIRWAVLRRAAGENESAVTAPDEKLDVYTAVDACTRNSVFTNHDEEFLGRIEKGCYADLVFLDRDIFTVPPDEIAGAKILRTICAGETVYE